MRRLNTTDGRWLTPDPLGGDFTNPQSLNRYAYVLNNPTTLTDPLGLHPPGRPCSSGTIWDCVHKYYCGTLYCGYDSSINSPFGFTPFEAIFQTQCDEEGCSTTINEGASAMNFGGVFDGPANLPGAPVRSQPATSSRLSCTGSARVLQGNAKTIGNPGGFSGKSAGIIPVTANGAAVIPSQWGGKSTLRPFLNQIGGIFPNVNYSFQGVVDVVGSNRIPNVQAFLMSKNPGDLILELPGAPKDFGVTPVTLTIPGALPCPAGTAQVPQ